MTEAEQTVRCERVALKGVVLGEIVLDREAKRNALTPTMLEACVEGACEFAFDDAVRAIVMRGEGETFCSGFDLKMCLAEPGVLKVLLERLAELMGVLRAAPKPVVIGVQGGAIAGAAALLGAADVVVASEHSKLGYPVVRLGISPAVSGASLVRSLGMGASRRRLLVPDVIDAVRAHELGWVHVLVGLPEDVRPRAQIEAAKLGGKPAGSFASSKLWLNECDGSDDAAAAKLALQASLDLVGSEEERRLLAAAFAR